MTIPELPDFPGTNLNDLNLDWLISQMQELDSAFKAWPHSPQIQNGNWYVWDETLEDYVDTGVSATGPRGEAGPTGPVGPAGPQGNPGAPGGVTQAEFDELSGEVDDLKSALDQAPTEETGQELLTEEELNTLYTEYFLKTLDRIFSELPQDESLSGIVDELVEENSWLDQLYREVAAAKT